MLKGLRGNMVAGGLARMVRSVLPLSLLVFLGVMLGGLPARAQNTLIFERADGDIHIFQDVCSYRNPSDPTQTYVEVYYALDRSQMSFIELPDSPGVYSAAWEIRTVVETEIGDQVTWNSWYRVSQDSSLVTTEANQTVFDIYWPPLLLTPGVYKFVTTITDLNSRISGDVKVGVHEQMVVVADYAVPDLTVSDIEFAARLGRASSENYFTKNSLLVVPNPTRTFGVNMPVLSFYAEIYGLTMPGGTESTYTRTVSIEGLDVDYRKVLDNSTREVRSRDDLIAVTNINVGVIPRGFYRLQVEVVDNTSGARAVRQKDFRVVSDVAPVVANELNTAVMNEQSIQRFRNEIEFLASNDQLEVYDRAGPEDKRDFLIAFWKERDPNPGTPQNEFRIGWLERFSYAEKNFTSPTQPAGWRTDQGRVWIVYGRPDDIIPHPMESGSGMPWVEWIYNQIESIGRASFIFADTGGGFGTYHLINTNVPGEIQNPDWRNELGIPPTSPVPAGAG